MDVNSEIEKAEVIAAKAKYEKALYELKVLLDNMKQINDKKVLGTYHSSDKSLEEILKFLQEGNKEEN